MIMACLGCAVLAAWLAVAAPTALTLRSRLAPVASVPATDGSARGEEHRRRKRCGPFAIMIILLTVIGRVWPARQSKGRGTQPVRLCSLE